MSTLALIAVHFPKAGGTSIAEALKRAFGDNISLDYAEDPALPESARQIDPIRYFNRRPVIPDQARCIYGHFHINKYRLVENVARFTLLRHPIDTVLSGYFYWQMHQPTGNLHRYVVENRLGVVDMARLPIFARLMSETYFGGADMRSFDLIGRHDKRTESLTALSEIIGIPLDADIHTNVTAGYDARSEMEQDRALIELLGDILRDDIRFYERHAFRDL